ncbi:DNA-binding LacI/PurR family transcriptional regulator [Agromyces cerinus]|uniref:LacI family DNA-binding transcriptional regulator n=1 Tax=Agromyces cerinus TaxID=33878 RepID=UPI00195BABC4|nr:LacI family DNA-binding transcriptional regulator [Agromyces cerinus]MBM7830992.1 DNA-binding LacI/PurR family transcriptional regulator [Agromyces cerinus]
MSSTPRSSAGRAPDMADVAALAGVSKQTVSRALSNHPNVTARTRAKVEEAVARLGYRRNAAASMLSSGRSRTIGIVSMPTLNYSSAVISYGMERAARAAGYAVSMATTTSLSPEAIAEAMSRLAEQAVEGIVLVVPLLVGSDATEEISRRIPTVTIDGSRSASTQVVAVDQTAVGRIATEHLLSLGHETVWHLAGPGEWVEAGEREDGWRAALGAAGREAPPILRGDWSPESGYQAGLLLARMPEVTAIFASSDEMAFGVIRALHEHGRRVPDDVSVIGVDDIALAAYCSPALTTVAQPFEEIGRLAVDHLIEVIADPDSTPSTPTTVAASLVVRGSTAAPA